MQRLVVRVQEAAVVADGGPGWFIVSGLPDPQAVADKAASAGGAVAVDDHGRLRALVTPTQLVNAVGRVDASLGGDMRERVDTAVDSWLAGPVPVPIGDRTLGADGRPVVMGIVNVTPDSFADGGTAHDPATHPQPALDHARALAAAGADILDVGGESTRPGADPVPADEELARVVPVVEALADDGVPVSIDTSKAAVARAAVAAGAAIVNDVSAGTLDDELLATVAALEVPYVLMHMQGTPRTMQDAPTYHDVVSEVYEFLEAGLVRVAEVGIDLDRVVVDPGIGFGKTAAHNVALLRALRQFTGLGRPVLVGTSRKSFLGQLAEAPTPADRVPGSVATAVAAVLGGAMVVRVHDVAETRQAVDVAAALRS